MSAPPDGFLSRWSRKKAQVQSGVAVPVDAPERALQTPRPALEKVPAERASAAVAPPPSAAVGAGAGADAVRDAPVEAVALPTMADVALLTRSSDYSRFVGPGVDSHVKNAAMKKLFSDPRFNVMDGLDTYIDDYNTPDLIPPAMLRQMNQSKFLGLFDDEDEPKRGEMPTEALTTPDGAEAAVVAESCPLEAPDPEAPDPEAPDPEAPDPPRGGSQPRPDDHSDLRLQQDDPTERPGPARGVEP